MGFFYGGYNSNPYNTQYGNTFYAKPVSPVDNAPVWFVAVVPIVSLFIEEIIMNKVASIFLWILTYILSVYVCKYDKDKILARCYDSTQLKMWYFVPIVYLIMRNKVTRLKSYTVMFAVATLLIALVSNGFVRYAVTTDDDYITTLQKYSCSQIINFEDYQSITDDNILETIQSYVGHDSILWTCSTHDNISSISACCSFDNNGKTSDLEIGFELKYDGFSFDGIEIVSLTVDGKELSEENEKAMLMQIFSKEEKTNTVEKSDDNLIEV